jgi:C4-dicarboxylate transporter
LGPDIDFKELLLKLGKSQVSYFDMHLIFKVKAHKDPYNITHAKIAVHYHNKKTYSYYAILKFMEGVIKLASVQTPLVAYCNNLMTGSAKWLHFQLTACFESVFPFLKNQF